MSITEAKREGEKEQKAQLELFLNWSVFKKERKERERDRERCTERKSGMTH